MQLRYWGSIVLSERPRDEDVRDACLGLGFRV